MMQSQDTLGWIQIQINKIGRQQEELNDLLLEYIYKVQMKLKVWEVKV